MDDTIILAFDSDQEDTSELLRNDITVKRKQLGIKRKQMWWLTMQKSQLSIGEYVVAVQSNTETYLDPRDSTIGHEHSNNTATPFSAKDHRYLVVRNHRHIASRLADTNSKRRNTTFQLTVPGKTAILSQHNSEPSTGLVR